ncbi:hypothetical protein GQ53DRAFT_344550 [Thozetella sp. PMI_491]|nr:hypothetical protein GQ53DRAFT_344550 [Thozetella sp. PMI_491]
MRIELRGQDLARGGARPKRKLFLLSCISRPAVLRAAVKATLTKENCDSVASAVLADGECAGKMGRVGTGAGGRGGRGEKKKTHLDERARLFGRRNGGGLRQEGKDRGDGWFLGPARKYGTWVDLPGKGALSGPL